MKALKVFIISTLGLCCNYIGAMQHKGINKKEAKIDEVKVILYIRPIKDKDSWFPSSKLEVRSAFFSRQYSICKVLEYFLSHINLPEYNCFDNFSIRHGFDLLSKEQIKDRYEERPLSYWVDAGSEIVFLAYGSTLPKKDEKSPLLSIQKRK